MGTTVLLIDESTHVIHRSGAAGLGAAWRYCGTGYTVRIRHKGIPLCQQRQCVLHSNVPCLTTVAPTWYFHTKHMEIVRQCSPCPIPQHAIFALPLLSLPASRRYHASCLSYVALPIHWRCYFHHRQRYHRQHSPPPLYKGVVKACMTNQTCVAPDANHLLACGTVHTSSKSDEVMIANICVRGTISCNNCEHT